MLVVEKEKAVQEVSEVVGKVELRTRADIEKYKKKAAPMMFGSSYDQ